MTPREENPWSEWRQHVLAEIVRLDKDVVDIQKRCLGCQKEMTGFKVKFAMLTILVVTGLELLGRYLLK